LKDSIIKQKFDTLRTFPTLKPEILQIAENYVNHSDDWKLLRVNPLKFATEHSLSESDSVDFFVHAAKLGLNEGFELAVVNDERLECHRF
jgi:hypothetical protein